MAMLHHVSVGVANVERAARFYDATLKALGYKRVMEFMPYGVAYGEKMPEFWVQLPHNGGTASVGNGVHVCFSAKDKKAVHAFHKAAIKAGGKDEGAPGPRPDYSTRYYGAFARDIDGHKIEAVFFDITPAKAKPKATKKAAPKRKAGAKKKARRKGARR
jgi:catechol 2,3-dioxygenase-like lactoylglutathione lyase family enzyme